MSENSTVGRTLVNAPIEEVTTFLRTELTPDDFQNLAFSAGRRSRLPGIDRGIDSNLVITIISFTAEAVAAGIVYDTLKEITAKLINRFGRERVHKE